MNPDGVHFSRDAQADFGRRYFEAWRGVREKLAADPAYWKKAEPPKDLAKAYPIPEEQYPELAKIPLAPEIERYLFPGGVPAALRKAREDAAPAAPPAADGWTDPKAGWNDAPRASTATREKVSLNGLWAFGIDNDGAAVGVEPVSLYAERSLADDDPYRYYRW